MLWCHHSGPVFQIQSKCLPLWIFFSYTGCDCLVPICNSVFLEQNFFLHKETFRYYYKQFVLPSTSGLDLIEARQPWSLQNSNLIQNQIQWIKKIQKGSRWQCFKKFKVAMLQEVQGGNASRKFKVAMFQEVQGGNASRSSRWQCQEQGQLKQVSRVW